ncbi:PREDICTED: orexigenic neuropeptide QRFP [Nanorana parkeri]|uniref:orexigenic neuropeptide QRFP n=1 Tax=Nanorana parkeri TaxID=125878 RepID=UPI0008540C1F|nr:PREDICTED: orexigenic neuropeptide QRFP [Nanorana parkeri]
MKGASGLSLLLLMVCGSSFGLQESMEDREPWERIQLWKILTDGEENIPASLLRQANLREKKSTDPASLFSVAKELQGFGKERAGFRFRFGRRDEGNDVEDFEPQIDKRVGTALGSLAEELNGYNRKKGGFSFRFGRR